MAINFNQINKNFFNKKKQIKFYTNDYIQLEKPEIILFNKFINNNCRVLDIGCGAGRTTYHISKLANYVIGIDYAENMIKEARQKFSNIDFRLMNALNLEFPDNSFDIVIFSYNGICCIYPEEKRIKALSEINRVLKNGGIFIYSVLNKYRPHSLSSFINAVISIPLSGLRGNYKFHLTRTGLILLYENNSENEIAKLKNLNFKFLEQHPSETFIKVFSVNKPVWTYYALNKNL